MADYDAIVIGAGHNGLVCAAYLARGGMRTLLVEARASVGGTSSSEHFAGATVNICNCDHIAFRTTPIADELGLYDLGLAYENLDPAQVNMVWGPEGDTAGSVWAIHHDVEQTLDGLARTQPSEVDSYRDYLAAAIPVVSLILAAANEPPSLGGLTRKVLEKRGRGVSTLFRWSRRSAADVMRSFFSTEAMRAPALLTGPMVWGISPEFSGSGLGAITYAMRHVGTLGRPIGGSGMVGRTVLSAFENAGGVLRTSSPVSRITCDGARVRGVRLADGTEVTAGVVVSACNPHDTFLQWLSDPPPQARDLVDRWRAIPHDDGYESKIDAVTTEVPTLRAVEAAGITGHIGATYVISPTIPDMHRAHSLMQRGEILERPGLLANVPTAVDPALAPEGRHVLSLEALFTPYGFRGGWTSPEEPRRWLDLFASLAQPSFASSITDWRAMTPDRYETEFHMPHGHATSFAGGPLAALRNANPELTRYETPVQGLYLTGAATFPGAGVWGSSGRNAATVVLRTR